MATLQEAIALASKAHAGQKDWSGAPYVNHPLRVAGHMSTEEEKMTAVLHDVVEDTSVTLTDLRAAGYPEAVVQAVDALSRRRGEAYEDYIGRVKLNALARRVKIADLEDNMNLNRVPHPRQGTYDLVQKYRRCWQELTAMEIADPAAPKSIFKFYAVFSTKHEIRGLFAFYRGGNRLDSLAWNHRSKRWEVDYDISGRSFFRGSDFEEVSPARAREIAGRFGALVPSDAELMKISDDAEVRRQSGRE